MPLIPEGIFIEFIACDISIDTLGVGGTTTLGIEIHIVVAPWGVRLETTIARSSGFTGNPHRRAITNDALLGPEGYRQHILGEGIIEEIRPGNHHRTGSACEIQTQVTSLTTGASTVLGPLGVA